CSADPEAAAASSALAAALEHAVAAAQQATSRRAARRLLRATARRRLEARPRGTARVEAGIPRIGSLLLPRSPKVVVGGVAGRLEPSQGGDFVRREEKRLGDVPLLDVAAVAALAVLHSAPGATRRVLFVVTRG